MTRIVLQKSQIAPSLKRRVKGLQQIAQQGHTHFKKITPKRSGNAKNRTVLNKGNIEANYPYAVRLDKGWSRQAPRGMVQPTIEYMRKLVNHVMKGK
jgi:hypothetical protein